MGSKTKIDWCDSTWNPVTGCLHGCEYCYARRIANRFCGMDYDLSDGKFRGITDGYIIDTPQYKRTKKGKIVHAPYPFGFAPTLHRYELIKPLEWKEPKTIFVCSVADLFGEWVPDVWIDEVLKASQRSYARMHRYLFLTKNPSRYDELLDRFKRGQIYGLDTIQNCFFGASATTNKQLERAFDSAAEWIYIEPIREELDAEYMYLEEALDGLHGKAVGRWKWVVIGAETGNSINKVIPKKEWVQNIVEYCKYLNTPVFMKESLRNLMGEDFRQEYPW